MQRSRIGRQGLSIGSVALAVLVVLMQAACTDGKTRTTVNAADGGVVSAQPVETAAATAATGTATATPAVEDGTRLLTPRLRTATPAATPGAAAAFIAGEPWTGRPVRGGGLSEEEARAFAAYPLLWAGPGFAGFHLQSIARTTARRPQDAPPTSRAGLEVMNLLYGSCTAGSDGVCAVPANIQIRPACIYLPEQAPAYADKDKVHILDGGAVQVQLSDSAFLLWTGPISILVALPAAPDQLSSVVAQLQPLNDSAQALVAAGTWPAPDIAGCTD